MRVLHLIDAASPQASPTTLALLKESSSRFVKTHGHQVLLLGGEELSRQARMAGIRGAHHLGVPGGRAYLGWPAIAGHLRRRTDFDVVHCWSIGTLATASLMMRSTPRVLTITQTPSARGLRWLRVLAHTVDATVYLTLSNTLRRALLGGGVPSSAVHVLRPGLDMAQVAHADRAAVRQNWGIETDDSQVVALLSDPPHNTDSLPAALAVCLSADSSLRCPIRPRLLTHPNQRHRRRAQIILSQMSLNNGSLLDTRIESPWAILPACDVALTIGPHGGGLSMLWAMAANVPILGEATYAISEIVEDRHSALLVKPDQPASLAHKLDQLLQDPQLAWRLRDTARHEAYSFFSCHRYGQSLQTVYEQLVAGQSIEVPALETTGGLRFSGRG